MNGCTSLHTTSKCKDIPAHLPFSSARFAISLQSSSDTFKNKDANGIDSLNNLSNKIQPFEGYHEREGLLNRNTDLTSTLLMSNRKKNITSKHSETQNKLKQTNTEIFKTKRNILITKNASDSIIPSSSDDSSYPQSMFYVKAILGCVILVILGTCICACHKKSNVIALYGKSLMEIWRNLA